ncbi:sulfurtransferase [Microbacterium telephonicum]|uniref:Thiosulfate/3-mercaptopyruvate sulfurtransferase n=1 Tax=Microbacterium telephonicum TaxID=1714841 RepID=A0A498CCC0_9MICO|nr:sulfurtransferase [Microbacterium telephonicum]RLK52709.1 thiosulfate/3-mercaptopyruvate sulfurtransferase [Microbacterium telephonicum]
MPSSDLITPHALADLLGARHRVRLLDVRWNIAEPDGRPAYESGHLPGAVYVDLDGELASHGAPTEGRHPLPATADLQAAARRWGLDDGDTVVVYDDWGSRAAARAWWLLVDAGIADVRILDGGLAAWRAAGLPLETGDAQPARGGVSLASGRMPQLTIDEAAALPASGVLIDARAGERYRGETEPIDPRAGHIPGAVNVPTTATLDDAGRFLAPDALRERFALAADAEVGAYCGSGVTAAHTVFALRLAGIDAALYPGSWSQWSNHPARPVATGPTP